jgi:hypothetical protein
MAWNIELQQSVSEISAKFPDNLECDYVDPAIGRSLVEHLKSYWLVRQLHGYADGYEANKVKTYLEPHKFTEKDWLCIAKVCNFGRSWAFRQLENLEG